eukprot:COSAG05_NODE_709_length_7823_cov_2.423485_3_plen_113_part_00
MCMCVRARVCVCVARGICHLIPLRSLLLLHCCALPDADAAAAAAAAAGTHNEHAAINEASSPSLKGDRSASDGTKWMALQPRQASLSPSPRHSPDAAAAAAAPAVQGVLRAR